MSDSADPSGGRARRSRGGGGAARRAERMAPKLRPAPAIRREIPDLDLLPAATLDLIEANAETVLEEIGVRFTDNPQALARWADAGARIDGDRVRLPRGLARNLCATAPARFTQQARNPARSVEIGGRDLVLAPVYGPPFVRDLDGVRRYATLQNFRDFVKLAYMSPNLHHSGGTLCEPTDVPGHKKVKRTKA